MNTRPYVPPTPDALACNCPHCHAYSAHNTQWLAFNGNYTDFKAAICRHCGRLTLWLEQRMIYPEPLVVPEHHEELPEPCRVDYNEAREIFDRSPRGSAALLRLVIQKLMVELKMPGKNINDDIAALVKAGLAPQVQKALDICRVVGNNAVHPGEMDLSATPETTRSLFDLINFIVDDRIAKPKQVDALFNALPAGAKAAIVKRDT